MSKNLTDTELDIMTAETVMKWHKKGGMWYDKNDEYMALVSPTTPEGNMYWHPSTDITYAFLVDKPEWEWNFDEMGDELTIKIWEIDTLVAVCIIPLNRDNKIAAYCRGRCIAACNACSGKEIGWWNTPAKL